MPKKNKKIEYLNEDNISNTNVKKQTMKTKNVGSKTSKKPQKSQKGQKVQKAVPKKRGRRPTKIIKDADQNETSDVSSNNDDTSHEQSDDNEEDDDKNDDKNDDHHQENPVIVRLKLNSKNMKKTNSNTKKVVKKKVESDNSDEEDNADTEEEAQDDLSDKHDKKNEQKTLQPHRKVGRPSKNKQTRKLIDEYQDDETTSDRSDGIFGNDIPCDKECNKCTKLEKAINMYKNKLDKYEQKEKINKSNKVHSIKINLFDIGKNKKITLKKTNIKCWWDCHSFNTLPCFLPEFYHNDTYHVLGCFCSFNCALAYNLYYMKDSKIHIRKSLALQMYREMYNISDDKIVEIKESPSRELLQDFSGDKGMSIETFRKTLQLLEKDYIIYMPPTKPITMYIEEKNMDSEVDNGKKYTLKRSKPLVSSKGSILSSMKIKLKHDDSDDD
jgi:hypothetical protein